VVALSGCVYKVGTAEITLTFSTERGQASNVLQAQSDFQMTDDRTDTRQAVQRELRNRG